MEFMPDRSHSFVDRFTTFKEMARYRAKLHNFIRDHLEDLPAFENLTGLVLSQAGLPDFLRSETNIQLKYEVSSLFPVKRIGPDGDLLNQLFFSVTQQIPIRLDPQDPNSITVLFRGGCTLVLDLDSDKLVYRIVKPINDYDRFNNELDYLRNHGSGSLGATYFSHFKTGIEKEPFAQLHRGD
jgi:hypothetical protein